MTASILPAGPWRQRAGGAPVPRQALTFVRLPMPALGRKQLLDAARLQLTQYMTGGAFGFVCRRQSDGQMLAWAWTLHDGLRSPQRGGSWPEPALDEPQADGLHLLRRGVGFEGQHWQRGELLHSRWFAALPDAQTWQAFSRGCGLDPETHPLPQATPARAAASPIRGWLAGDNLPAADPWQGWRWQAALLLLGAALAAALGVHLQTREQLQLDQQRLAQLRSGRESALQARARYEQTASELDALSSLAPRLTQLELFDRVTSSGIFAPAAAAPTLPASAAVDALGPTRPQLLEWDFRNGQLKVTLELPERDLTLLELTRRFERVPGLGVLRVGQDSTGNTLSLIATVADLLPPGAEGARNPGPLPR